MLWKVCQDVLTLLSAVGRPLWDILTGFQKLFLNRSIKDEKNPGAEKQKCRLGEMALELD